MTLIEVMVAGAMLLIGVLGLVLVVRYAATANAMAHRRTAMTYFRSAVLDRIAVTPRLGLATVPSQGTWLVDSCWDINSTLVGNNSGVATPGNIAAYSSTYACPAGTLYRSWVNVSPLTAAAGNCNAVGACYQVSMYVERSAGSGFVTASDNGCTPATRYSADSCVAADLLYTD